MVEPRWFHPRDHRYGGRARLDLEVSLRGRRKRRWRVSALLCSRAVDCGGAASCCGIRDGPARTRRCRLERRGACVRSEALAPLGIDRISLDTDRLPNPDLLRRDRGANDCLFRPREIGQLCRRQGGRGSGHLRCSRFEAAIDGRLSSALRRHYLNRGRTRNWRRRRGSLQGTGAGPCRS